MKRAVITALLVVVAGCGKTKARGVVEQEIAFLSNGTASQLLQLGKEVGVEKLFLFHTAAVAPSVDRAYPALPASYVRFSANGKSYAYVLEDRDLQRLLPRATRFPRSDEEGPAWLAATDGHRPRYEAYAAGNFLVRCYRVKSATDGDASCALVRVWQ